MFNLEKEFVKNGPFLAQKRVKIILYDLGWNMFEELANYNLKNLAQSYYLKNNTK